GVDTGRAWVEIRDHGPGIPAQHRLQIFEKFERVPGRTDVRGAGLGLPISREIMRRLGGNLVLAEGEGTGAVFRIALALVQTSSAAHRTTAPQPDPV
ncbi:MAG: sensor histidine kinase, partial [Pseudomonadota bacterium]